MLEQEPWRSWSHIIIPISNIIIPNCVDFIACIFSLLLEELHVMSNHPSARDTYGEPAIGKGGGTRRKWRVKKKRNRIQRRNGVGWF